MYKRQIIQKSFTVKQKSYKVINWEPNAGLKYPFINFTNSSFSAKKVQGVYKQSFFLFSFGDN